MSSNMISQVTPGLTPGTPQHQTSDAQSPPTNNNLTTPPLTPIPSTINTQININNRVEKYGDLAGNTNHSRHAGEAQHYDHDTVLVLLAMMKRAGYGDRRQQKKSLKEVFAHATELAKKEHGIKRSAKAWQKKFTRMKQEYSALVAKISESGRGGDDEDLYNRPEFYKEMHELEHNKARHDPPAILCSAQGSAVSDLPLTSTRKRVKLSHASLMESFFEQHAKRQDDLVAEIKRSNDEKCKMRSVLERLVEKL